MDYNNLKELYTQRLIARGYKENYINSLAITTPDRNTLLQNIIQPTIKSSSDTNPLIFITTNTPRQQKINMKNILTVPPHISDSTIGQRLFKKRRNNSDVILCYKKTKTIRQLLTRSLYDYELQPQLQLQQQHQQ